MLTQQALDFLVENQLNDSNDWFEAHREEYEKFVREPMFELIDFLGEKLEAEIEPEIMRNVKRAISRVRRDTRFTNDKTKYRPNVWFFLGRDKRYYPYRPTFFFELHPGYAWWGCGMHIADTPMLDSYRRAVLERRPEFLRAAECFDSQTAFELDADGAFKRTKFPAEPPEIRRWLDRKGVYIAHTVPPEEAFDPNLGERIIDEFRLIYPFYEFLRSVCDGAFRKELL